MKYLLYYRDKREVVDIPDNSTELFKLYKLVGWLTDNFKLTPDELDEACESFAAGYKPVKQGEQYD